MATPVLIIGKSGAGKSTSMRNCSGNDDWNVIRVLNKPLPFKGKINGWKTDDYQTVMKCLYSAKAKNIVLDDAGYLITNQFMNGHASQGAGNAIFSFYNKIGDSFWNLITFITDKLPEEKIEEKNASDAVVKKALNKEGKAILSNVRKGAAIVAMCIEGKQISSDELAQFLAQRAGSGAGDVAFVIGSSHGLSDEVKKAAALKFSMGRITMPHQLARLVLTEQIYRACTINAGMKYHK